MRLSKIKSITAHRHEPGFTLIEVMVAVFGFTLIAYGLIALVSNIFLQSSQQSSLLAGSDQARKVAFNIVTELRNGQLSSGGAYALDTAGDQSLIFYSNIDKDSAIEKVRYFVQGGKLWKGLTQFNGSTYPASTETTAVVQSDIANGSNPLFYYYDGSYIGSSTQTSLTQPVNVTQVKFVQIKLQVFNKAGVKNTNFYTVTASGAIRNLKTNLGQ